MSLEAFALLYWSYLENGPLDPFSSGQAYSDDQVCGSFIGSSLILSHRCTPFGDRLLLVCSNVSNGFMTNVTFRLLVSVYLCLV